MTEKDFRAGFVGLIGAPNAGKSTLLNAFLGQKVAITSAKPQTTRRRILGVVTRPQAQMVFLDTPGLHDPKSPLHKGLVSVALGAMEEADVVLWLLDAARPRPREEGLILGHLRSVAKPVLVALNKIDLVNKARLLPMMERLSRERDFAAIVPISALTGDGLEILAGEIIKLLPPGEAVFPPDALTDQTERDLAAEFIREQVLRFTEQEVPHGAAVVVETWQDKPEKNLTVISAVICVEKDSHKGILIGGGGERLKMIGQAARAEIEALLDRRVYLELFVRVEKNWTRDPGKLTRLGFPE